MSLSRRQITEQTSETRPCGFEVECVRDEDCRGVATLAVGSVQFFVTQESCVLSHGGRVGESVLN